MKRFLLFIGLAGLSYWLINQAATFENQRVLQTKLVQTDTANITRIVVFPRHQETAETVLNRTEAGWVATKEVKNILINPTISNQIMEDIAAAKVMRVVGKFQKDSPNFGLGKAKSRRIQLFANHQLITDFVVGFVIPEQENISSWITYFRYVNGEEVYEVDGKIGLTLAQPFATYFDKTISNILPWEVQKVVLESQDSSSVLKKNANGYFLNQMPVADSLQIEQYFVRLAKTHRQIKKADFIMDFDEIAAADLLLTTLNIYSVKRPEPIKISLFYDSTAVKPFIIHSSLNKDTYFSSDSAGLYQTIFQPWSTFIRHLEPSNEN